MKPRCSCVSAKAPSETASSPATSPPSGSKGGQTVLVEKQDVLALLEDIVPGTEIE